MATAHIRAEKGDFAETILLPGDPLRAKYIAENFLTDVVQVNDVRGMLGYTGNYQGKRVSVMGSGMGMPSIGIYAHELITQFGVKNLIRVGSCGSYQADVHVRDIIIGQAISTNSNWQSQYDLPGTFAPVADWGLMRAAVEQ
ncbi:MAG: purine-nucleoside phosphorylase, partial [Culicoidibacterales bacterium]